MTIKEYAEEVRKLVGQLIPNATVTVMEIPKNNGVIYTGVNVRAKGSNIAPTIYLDPQYESNVAPGDAAQSVLDIIAKEKLSMQSVDMNFLMNFENAKEKLRAKLLNVSNKVDVFRSAKRYGFEDLIIVPYVMADGIHGFPSGSITVNNQMLEIWKATAKEVIDIALKNSKKEARVRDLLEYTGSSILFPDSSYDGPRMLVINNTADHYGAISVLGKIGYLKRELKDFYIIPSSVHEVIAIENFGSEDYIKMMVKEVNSNVVDPAEKLSDNIYHFKKEERR